MVTPLDSSNFGYYALNPDAEELSERDKKIAWIASVAMGILTLGVGHLICYLFFNYAPSGASLKTEKVALDALQNNPDGKRALERIDTYLQLLKNTPSANTMSCIAMEYRDIGDIKNGKIWYEKAAKLGDELAMRQISIWAKSGEIGYLHFLWIKSAFEQAEEANLIERQNDAYGSKDPVAMYDIAKLYQEKSEFQKAIVWYSESAKLGNLPSMKALRDFASIDREGVPDFETIEQLFFQVREKKFRDLKETARASGDKDALRMLRDMQNGERQKRHIPSRRPTTDMPPGQRQQ